MREQRIRLYLVVGVPEDTEFNPQTRKEISVSSSVYRSPICPTRDARKFYGLIWTIYQRSKLSLVLVTVAMDMQS